VNISILKAVILLLATYVTGIQCSSHFSTVEDFQNAKP